MRVRRAIFLFFVFVTTESFAQTKGGKYYSIQEALRDSVSVRYLSLTDGNLIDLPIDLLKLKNLEEIDIEKNPNLDIQQVINLLADFSKLKKIFISDVKHLIIPKEIGRLKKLEELDLSNDELTQLPIEILQLKKLKEIDIGSDPSLNLSQTLSLLSQIKSLRVLWLSNDKLTDIPEEISGFNNLEDLWLDGNEFTTIPESVKKLHIKYLSLFDNHIKQISLERGDLSNLSNINLCYNEFQVFPIQLSILPKLVRITMWYNPVKLIPKEIENLKNIRDINLDNNEIAKIPPQMSKLKSLTKLSLGGNKLTSEDMDALFNLTNLGELNLNSNMVTKLPEDIGNLKHLKHLDISGNLLKGLPKEILKLKKLEQLGMGDMQEFDWVSTFSILQQLPNLKRVGMYSMKLQKMPVGFENLSQVDVFWLNGNSFDNEEQQRLKNLLPHSTLTFD